MTNRRFHSRMLGWGGFLGMAPPRYPCEVMLKGLPSPMEANPARFARFQREVAASLESTEPFYDITAVAAGMKHIAMVTSEGQLICAGSNSAGQIGQPIINKSAQRVDDYTSSTDGNGVASPSPPSPPPESGNGKSDPLYPFYYDLEFDAGEVPNAVSCGSSFTIFYHRRVSSSRTATAAQDQNKLRRKTGEIPPSLLGPVIAMGTNVLGQLGLGHKDPVANQEGLAQWAPDAPWLASTHGGPPLGIREITSGTNHSIMTLTDGSLYGFGSNLFGELALGDTTSPMYPKQITFFDKRNLSVRKVACGRSTTYFLLSDGRVYGCGASRQGQLPENECLPVPVPVTRMMSNGESKKLVRVKDILAMGDAVVFLTASDELFFRGSFAEFGISVEYPKYSVISQEAAAKEFASCCVHGTESQGLVFSPKIARLTGSHSACFVVYESGHIAGFGANADGQLALPTPAQRFFPPAEFRSLIPLLSPFRRGEPTDGVAAIAGGSGFCMMLDHKEIYRPVEHDLSAGQPLIELPPPVKVPSTATAAKKRRLKL
jgi:hypothetical protein